jgi:hypothetical protein
MFLKASKPHAGPMVFVMAGFQNAVTDGKMAPFGGLNTNSSSHAHTKHATFWMPLRAARCVNLVRETK